MLKIKDKIKFKHTENLMKQEGDVVSSINDIDKNKALQIVVDRKNFFKEYEINNWSIL